MNREREPSLNLHHSIHIEKFKQGDRELFMVDSCYYVSLKSLLDFMRWFGAENLSEIEAILKNLEVGESCTLQKVKNDSYQRKN